MTRVASLPSARRAHILAALARDGVVSVSRLSDDLGVTPVTLRRDLAQMEEDGLLSRVHGGAVPISHDAVPAEPANGPHDEPATPPLTGSLAVLVPSLSFYWPDVVRSIQGAAWQHGLRSRVHCASYELQDERPLLERLVDTDDVRALIVAPNPDTPHAPEVAQWIEECAIPTVLVEREVLTPSHHVPVENVTTDHALGAVLAARYLAGLGHQRVGLILSRESPTARKIGIGWNAACTALQLEPAEHFEELFPPRSSPDFTTTVNRVIDTIQSTGVTGVLVHSDPEAMALIDLAMGRGLSIPEDLSVIAYDDVVAPLFTPPLTAVRPPREAIGVAAVDLVVQRLRDPERPTHRVTLNPTLNVRQSTAPVRG
jgi:DNA-binding LacI/PurR family transcriptional regulator